MECGGNEGAGVDGSGEGEGMIVLAFLASALDDCTCYDMTTRRRRISTIARRLDGYKDWSVGGFL